MQFKGNGKVVAVFSLSLIIMVVLALPAFAKPFKFKVISSPSDADVYMDDVYKGRTPAHFRMSPGRHRLTVIKQGFPNYNEVIDTRKVRERFVNFFPAETVRPGKLDITSTPKNAEVFINGVYRQKTPALITLEPGVYNLRLEKSGYYPYQDEVIIKKQRVLRLHPHLDKESFYGTALIRSNPPGARIFIGNRYYDTTPARIRIWAGGHRVRLEKEGYKTVTRTISVQRTREAVADINLKPVRRYGTVTLTTDPGGCKLFINGVYHGTSPGSARLLAGTHTLVLKKRGYEKQTHELLVKGGRSLQRSYRLVKKHRPLHSISTGVLKISSLPALASIRVDGRTLGNTPRAVSLSPGLHTVKLTAKGFKPYLQNVKVNRGTVKELKIQLTPLKPVKRHGTLTVTATQKARVNIDGVYRGDTPLTIRLDSGQHALKLHREGYYPYEKKVYLTAGKALNVHARLSSPQIKPPPRAEAQIQDGSIRFTSNPVNAKLIIDNKYQGTTPMGLTLKPGDHFIAIHHKGFHPYQQKVVVKPGRNPTLHAILRWKGHRPPTRVIKREQEAY